MNLNKLQLTAIDHFKEPMIVLAGPGSGKTTVITHRVNNLINKYKVDPSEILVITFTKSAAMEMSSRFKSLFLEKNVCFSTFHAFFFRIISSYYNFNTSNILSSEEQNQILKDITKSFQISQEDEKDFYKNMLNEISLIKNELLDIEYYHSPLMGTDDFRRIFYTYEDRKRELNKIDFDDMLKICYQLLTSNAGLLKKWQERYNYILIDEFQDINRVQYECIKILAAHNNLFVVGDDDQSIYRFRGASPEFLLNFPKDFKNCKKVILNTNYRSTDEIICFSNKIISCNTKRYEKDLIGVGRNGQNPKKIITSDIGAEAVAISNRILKISKNVSFNEIAIIYRTNIQARVFAEILMNINVPFQIKDEMPSIYDHWINKDMCAYLSLALDKSLNKEALRIINRPSRYISKTITNMAKNKNTSMLMELFNNPDLQYWQRTKIEELILHLNKIKKLNTYEGFKYIRNIVGYKNYVDDYADYRKINSKGLFEILDELQEVAKSYPSIEQYLEHIELAKTNEAEIKKQKNNFGVTLTTMHSAKGLEYDTVFIASCIDGLIPYEKSKTRSELEEERRLFYVALTRAKNNLTISVIKTRYEEKVEPSRFLDFNKGDK